MYVDFPGAGCAYYFEKSIKVDTPECTLVLPGCANKHLGAVCSTRNVRERGCYRPKISRVRRLFTYEKY